MNKVVEITMLVIQNPYFASSGLKQSTKFLQFISMFIDCIMLCLLKGTKAFSVIGDLVCISCMRVVKWLKYL